MSQPDTPRGRPFRMKGRHTDLFEEFRRPMMSHRIPIHQDDLSFEERQSKIWSDMEKDMERRRKEWEDDIDHMRKDFFHLKPEVGMDNKLESLTDRLGLSDNMVEDAKSSIEKDQQGRPVFRARFNVKDYKPEEVNVKMDNDKLIVTAKHEEKGGHKSVSREFSREINIPPEVDPLSLACTISSDGVLTAEALLPVPQYQQVTDAPRAGTINQRIIQTSSPQVSSAPPPQQPQPSGSAPPTHTSTFTTFMSPKGAVPAFQANAATPGGNVNITTNTVPRSFSPQTFSTSSSSTSKFETRSGSGSPSSMDRDRKYKVEVDIEDFSPDDLTIKTVDKKLVISARREERIGSRTSTKELNREFNLPDTVDPMSVKAYFSDSGKLLIEAPYLKPVAVGHYAEGGREGSPMTGR